MTFWDWVYLGTMGVLAAWGWFSYHVTEVAAVQVCAKLMRERDALQHRVNEFENQRENRRAN